MKKDSRANRWIFVLAMLWGMASEGALRAQTLIRFSNRQECAGVNAPFYDPNGSKLAGAFVLAQLYVGPLDSPERNLLPVGTAQPFLTGASAGYWAPADITLPLFAPGSTVLAQVRAWDSAGGVLTSFEAALAAAATVAVSPVYKFVLLPTSPPPSCPPNVVPPAGAQPVWSVLGFEVTRGAPQTVSGTMVGNGQKSSVPCGATVTATAWFRLYTTSPGEIVLNTDGSANAGIRAVTAYTGSIVDLANLVPVQCSRTLVPGHTNDIEVVFLADTNILYLLTVSGNTASTLGFQLNYAQPTRLDARPVPAGSGTGIELSWPADATNFMLQTALNLSGNTWLDVTNSPLVAKQRNALVFGVTNSRSYYRLSPR